MLKSVARRGAHTEILFQKVKNKNERITTILSEVGEFYKLQGNSVKSKSYEKAVKSLIALPYEITSKDQALHIPSIGKSMVQKIQTILETNRLPQLEELQQDRQLQKIRLFSKIHGVGPVQAKKWVNMGLESLCDLRKVKLTKDQTLGLKYIEDFEQRIPREEIDVVNEILTQILREQDPSIISMICGSYRRKLATSGDVDMIITHPGYTKDRRNQTDILKGVVNQLESIGVVTDRLSLGKTKFMGVYRLNSQLAPTLQQENFPHRRIDIRLIPKENYWCGVLYFTGSKFFNTQMRSIALERGYTLNEYELSPLNPVSGQKEAPIQVSSEKEIFNVIGLDYREPFERDL